jgi:acetyltransferase-like isoleucine patch superfamily enzyme
MTTKLRAVILSLVSFLPSFIKISIYRIFFGAKIGRGVRIGFGALLIFKTLELGDDSRIGAISIIRVKDIRLGQRVKIGILTRITVYELSLESSVTIGPQVSILASDRDPRCVFSAGSESWIFEYCYINPARPIRLGRNVGVGGGSYIFAHGLWLSKLKGYPVAFGEVVIGDDVWLPWGCFIMPGVSIGDGAVIGARSLISKDVPAEALAAGAPAKIVREKLASEPSHDEKIAILLAATEEMCSLDDVTCWVIESDNWLMIELNGRQELAFARKLAAPKCGELAADVLLVVPEPLRQLPYQARSAYSLQSFQSTPRQSLSRLQAQWLKSLRQIGTRFYPIDEVDVEKLD